MDTVKSSQTKSIQRFFLRIFIPIVLLVSSAFSVLMAWSDYESNRFSRLESQKIIFETFAAMIRQPIIQGSFVEARIRANELAKNPQIACIEITTAAETIKSCNGSKTVASGHYKMDANLYFSQDNTNLMGSLSITFDNSDLVSAIWKNTSKNAFGFIMLATILFAGLSVGFSRIRKELNGLMRILENHDSPSQKIFNFEISEFLSLAKHLKLQHDVAKSAAEAKAALEVARHVAHDIRSPIVSLQVALNAVQKKIDPKIRAVLNHSAQRISDIADDVINQHSKEADISIQKLPMSVRLALTEMISEKELLGKANLSLDFQAHDAFIAMRVSDFKRVISNLIDNSLQAVAADGNIEVTLINTEQDCQISIADNGVGIPQPVLKRILEIGGTFGKANGKGIGLQWAKKTIESHGGRFLMTSTEGQGTEVTLILPSCMSHSLETKEIIQPKLVEKLA